MFFWNADNNILFLDLYDIYACVLAWQKNVFHFYLDNFFILFASIKHELNKLDMELYDSTFN